MNKAAIKIFDKISQLEPNKQLSKICEYLADIPKQAKKDKEAEKPKTD